MDTSAFAIRNAISANNNPGPITNDPRLDKLSRGERLQLERAAYAQQVPVSRLLDSLEQQKRDTEPPRASYRNGVLFLDGRPATPDEVATYDRRNPYLPQNWKPNPLSAEEQAERQRSSKEISDRNAAARDQRIRQITQQVPPLPMNVPSLAPQTAMPAPFAPPNGVFQMPTALPPAPPMPPTSINPAAFNFPTQLNGVPMGNLPPQQPFFGLTTRTGRVM